MRRERAILISMVKPVSLVNPALPVQQHKASSVFCFQLQADMQTSIEALDLPASMNSP